jgi:hypothetical protein
MATGNPIFDAVIRANNRYEAEQMISEAIKGLGYVQKYEVIYGKKIEYFVPFSYSKKKYLFNKREKVKADAERDGVLRQVVFENNDYKSDYSKKLSAANEQKIDLLERNWVFWGDMIVKDRVQEYLEYVPTGARVPWHFEDDLGKLAQFARSENEKILK